MIRVPFTTRGWQRPSARCFAFNSSRPALWSSRYAAVSTGARSNSTAVGSVNDILEQGHIPISENEGLLYINNIAPLRLQWLYRLLWAGEPQAIDNVLKRVDKPSYAAADNWSVVRRALPSDLHVTVKQVLPRLNEGGLFVKYSLPAGKTRQDIATAVEAHLQKHPIRPWFNPLDRVGIGHVLGKPWIEDMYRLPSSRIKIEFLAPNNNASDSTPTELTQEALYSIFRRYGKIKDIERQPSDSKVLPKYAMLDFARVKYAILARNCIHGTTIPQAGENGGKGVTLLKITYERKIRAHYIKDWIFGHPRIVIPAIAALIAGITVLVFDPIRTFFIKMKVKYSLNADDKALWTWIRAEVRKANILSFGSRKKERNILRAIWDDRKEDIAQLQSWLGENGNTFIVVQGPHGSGKREIVVDQALKDRRHKLLIDCKQIHDARGDTQTISVAAQQVGYRPVFSWMNSISSFIDLAAQAVIGTKAGFSETLDSQLSKIWNNTASALRQIALENKKNDDRDNGLSEEEYLEAHPERRPVVVIDNFLHGVHEGSIVYDKIAEWAAALVTSNIAHVIFLTPDVSYSKSLSKALPTQVLRSISLGDCSLDVGRNFVLRYLRDSEGEEEKLDEKTKPTAPPGLEDLDECINIVGGRLTDLEFMAHRIKAGESPKKAVEHIIEQAATEILKMYVFDVDGPKDRRWTREQAWYMIKQIAENKDGATSYSRILLSDLFKVNGEAIISALEQADLITVKSSNGRPSVIKPGRPVYHAAFKHLTEDQVLRSRLDLEILKLLIDTENKNVSKYEDELQLLGNLKKYPVELYARIQWVSQKLQKAQASLEKYEKQSVSLTEVLRTN
ncbi:putative RNA12 protein [Talaromyces proteolyticus]|uniref:Mitochondrial escape protein 2 n=1 Tax=Talaromyces proteolyticus TaxID=1131652 RepID=A0AAD4Q0M0_9EURO|nr:putative RNA12 protein [Talaromyces proteolyticus]KAH8704253.1 putative RNA12 protein [Talaromyces proteolyticus]